MSSLSGGYTGLNTDVGPCPRIGADKKMIVIIVPANEDVFNAANTPKALKTVHNQSSRITHRYR